MNIARDFEEKKGLLNRANSKEAGEELELKQLWENGEGWEGGRKRSSPEKGRDAGKQAGCWVSSHISGFQQLVSSGKSSLCAT